MTALRQQMIRQMDLKNLSPHTRRSYPSAVTNLAKHYRQSPENITAEMIEDYQMDLEDLGSRRTWGQTFTFDQNTSTF